MEDGGKGLRANRSRGKLDSRRLYRAPYDQSIFAQTTTEEPAKVLLALLIDASGSMSERERYRRAIEVAAMFNEAFINYPYITLQTYSHTSTEMTDKCQVAYHGEANTRSRESIGSIEPKLSNYDYQAIWGVVAHLAAESANFPRRLLLSVSDGRPCVPLQENSTALTATRKAVDDVRRQGWTVCRIGIADYFAEEVYGKRWTLRVACQGALPHNMASLLVRLIRR